MYKMVIEVLQCREFCDILIKRLCGDVSMKEKLNYYHDIILTTEGSQFQLMVDDKLTFSDQYAQTIHAHSYYELFYVVSGSIDIVLDNSKWTLTEHMMFVVPPELLHRTQSNDDSLKRYIISFRVSDMTKNHPFYGLFHCKIPIQPKNPQDIENAFQRFCRYNEEHPAVRSSLMAACFQEILSLLKKEIIVSGQFDRHMDKDAYLQSMGSDQAYRNYMIDLYINRNFNRDISLKELSKLLYMSERHADRVVMAIYGQSFHERVIYLRMENAVKLLSETDMSVKTVATAVGFHSANGFYRSFGKIYGITPGEYRDKIKEKHR